MGTTIRQSLGVASRFGGAIIGGYIFALGFVAICSLVGFGAGLAFSDAQTLALMLGFLVFLGALLWAFVPRRNTVVWAVLAGGGLAMSVVAWVVSRMIAG